MVNQYRVASGLRYSLLTYQRTIGFYYLPNHLMFIKEIIEFTHDYRMVCLVHGCDGHGDYVRDIESISMDEPIYFLFPNHVP